MTPTLTPFHVGDRVRILSEVERYPHFIARPSLGTVVQVDPQGVFVAYDEHVDGCEEWDNVVHFPPDDPISSYEVERIDGAGDHLIREAVRDQLRGCYIEGLMVGGVIGVVLGALVAIAAVAS